jgi:hypothetical protein
MGRIDALAGLAILAMQRRVGAHPWTEATALPLIMMIGGRRCIIINIAIRPYCAVAVTIITSAIAR